MNDQANYINARLSTIQTWFDRGVLFFVQNKIRFHHDVHSSNRNIVICLAIIFNIVPDRLRFDYL